MSINPWGDRPIKSVLGWFFIWFCFSLPIVFIFIYKSALQGNIYMIILSVFQIFFQYIYNFKRFKPLMYFTKWMHYEKYFEEFNFYTEDVIEEKDSMFAVHPHNMFTLGLVFNHYQGRFGKRSTVLSTRSLLMLPGIGLLHQWTGVQGVDADNMKKLMRNHENFCIVPGGFEEATLACQKEQRVFINNRKGFIKYAIQGGYNLYPVFVFGENKAYYTVERFLNFRLALNRIKMVGVFFWSRFGFFLPECKAKINTVVGKPLKFTQCDKPDSAMVEKCHAQYVEALKNLYYSNRERFNETSDLHIY